MEETGRLQSPRSRAFPNCVTLVLVDVVELDYRLGVESVRTYSEKLFEDTVCDLQTLFPRLQCLDVVVDDDPRTVVAEMGCAPSAAALETADVETVLAPLMAAHLSLPPYRTERRAALPRMPHVHHLRLAGRGACKYTSTEGVLHITPLFYLHTDLSALRSLQTFGDVNLSAYSGKQRFRLPRLTHLAFHSPVNAETLRHLVTDAQASLVSLVRSSAYISADCNYVGPHCSRLRSVHAWVDLNPWRSAECAASLHRQLAAIPSLETIGLYSCSPRARLLAPTPAPERREASSESPRRRDASGEAPGRREASDETPECRNASGETPGELAAGAFASAPTSSDSRSSTLVRARREDGSTRRWETQRAPASTITERRAAT